METATLLGLLDAEATKLKITSAGTSALLMAAAAKIKSLEAASAPATERKIGLSDLAEIKREVDAGRGPNIVTDFSLPNLRL